MISVAVTGGIGSGKSALCKVLRSMRIPVLSADDLSKEIADSVPSVRKQIVALLGRDAYGPRGLLDREFVADRVFGKPRLLKRLEAILHPLVLKKVQSWIVAQRRKGKKVAVVEAALVFESGLDRLVDLVVVVDAPKEARVSRIQARDGSTKAQIRRRMDAQMSDRDRREMADVIIRNNGSKPALARRAKFLTQVLRKIST